LEKENLNRLYIYSSIRYVDLTRR